MDVETIARELTKAQRETLLWAWAYPDFHRNGEQVSFCPVPPNYQNGAALERKRLVALKANGGPRLTPTGLAVRQWLQENGG